MKFKRYGYGALIGLFVVGPFLWYQFSLRPAAKTGAQAVFTVAGGQGASQIARELKVQGLIRNAGAFEIYATFHGLRTKLQAGAYRLAPTMGVKEILRKISTGEVDAKKLTIPEGSTIKQIKELAAKQGIAVADFDVALRIEYTYDFLTDKPASVDLEGYLFPDTYSISPTTTAEQLVRMMLENFGRKVTPSLRAGIRARGLNLHEGLTLTSIIEREAPHPADRAKVAQVFYTRLQADHPLESDATVEYAAGVEAPDSATTAALIRELDSLYNTYKHIGLPPGSITNPGLTAIQAVVAPADTDYFYFLADREGNVHFARTLAEHNQKIDKYLR